MLKQRLLAAALLLPIGLVLIWAGGIFFFAAVALILARASWEYGDLFQAGGYRPARALTTLSVVALVSGRYLYGLRGTPFQADSWLLGLTVLAAMTWHLLAYERGRDAAGTDFAITLAGSLYVGHLGAYLVTVRELPDGLWWTLTVLPAVWLADSGAYFVGRTFGRRKLSPRLSPKKTREGYLGGLLVGAAGTALLALAWQALAAGDISVTPLRAGLLGLVLALVVPLGDLGKSMIKRQVGAKDSSNLIPGHGGVLDRIDTWLWGIFLGYYLILWMTA